MPVVIRVKYRMKPGKREELLKFVQENVDQTRMETGNIEYTHFPSMENDQDMFVFEMWEKIEDVNAHINAPHYLEFARKRKPLMESYDYKTFDASIIRQGDHIATW
ncbi:MAG: putative quinol monooxygenase [Lachnospiraceae bacterium]